MYDHHDGHAMLCPISTGKNAMVCGAVHFYIILLGTSVHEDFVKKQIIMGYEALHNVISHFPFMVLLGCSI